MLAATFGQATASSDVACQSIGFISLLNEEILLPLRFRSVMRAAVAKHKSARARAQQVFSAQVLACAVISSGRAQG